MISALVVGALAVRALRPRLDTGRTWVDDWRTLAAGAPPLEPGQRFRYAVWTSAGRAELTVELLHRRVDAVFGVLAGEDALVRTFRVPVEPDVRRPPPLAGASLDRGAPSDVSWPDDDLALVRTPAGEFLCGRARTSGFAGDAYARVDAWWTPELPLPVRVWTRPGTTDADLEPPAEGPTAAGVTLHVLVATEPGRARTPEELSTLEQTAEGR